MYKLKTTQSILKRFKITSKKKLLKHRACRSHLLQKKSSKRKRKLRNIKEVNLTDKRNFINSLPYIY
uniref:Large ribosomal subunit protein bL35c n=1 Tax=Digenea simplex TaxID=945030 RepID=A0A1Z1MUS1_DIGSM|nr:ribosomal protein L35 [Digenea simplex]ARW69551.1 ribosomal protein L35 [Digenea simplex]